MRRPPVQRPEQHRQSNDDCGHQSVRHRVNPTLDLPEAQLDPLLKLTQICLRSDVIVDRS
jgi:hypothetical protein